MASKLNITVSAYIREVVKKELESQKRQHQPIDFSGFAGMWRNQDISQKNLRIKAWK